jgi:MFS family permease
MPLTMAAARDHLPRARATATIATLSVIGAAGVGLGYPITGYIADHGGVSGAFWFGAVASGVALLIALVFVPSPPDRSAHGPLDRVGAVLVGAGVLALLLGVEQGPDSGWLGGPTLGLLALAAVLLAAWTRNELRAEAPLVELRLVRRRAVLTANVSGLVLGVAMYLGISLVTQLVQLESGLDGTVFLAGLTLLPLSACSLLSSRLMPAVRRRTGPRAIIPIGAGLFAVALLFLALTGDAVWQAFVTMALVGLGLGFTFAAMPGLIVSAVPRHETSSAMSFYQVSRYVGFSIGSGLAVTLLRAFDGDTPGADAYSSTLLVGAGLCLLAAAVAWLVPGRSLAGPAAADAAGMDEIAIEEGEIGAAGLQRLEER